MNLDEYSEVLKALAHPVRLKIACGLMRKEECCVSVMVEKLQVSQPTVSQHLTILKHAKIIDGFRKGNQICYRLTNEKVKKLIEAMEINICEQ